MLRLRLRLQGTNIKDISELDRERVERTFKVQL
jgi:hypothetical protein